MPTRQAEPILRFIRKLAATDRMPQLADRQLLERFVTEGSEIAFGALVQRHGPMVLGLCRRILANHDDAEDAFQATFLALSQKAGSVRARESVGGWLYCVAYRIAQKARIAAAKRHNYEARVADRQVADPAAEITLQEAHRILDRELARLPDKFRVPLVLCYLEGLTRDEAAQRLGWEAKTLKTRLDQARAFLRRRLAARGLSVTGALVASFFCEQIASASVSSALSTAAIKAAMQVATGAAATSVVSAKVAALSEGALRTMFLTKLKVATLASLAVLVIAAASGILIQATFAARPNAASQHVSKTPDAAAKAPKVSTGPSAPKPKVLTGGGWRMDWSPDGQLIAGVRLGYEKKQVIVFNSTVTLWDATTGDVRLSLSEEKNIRIESIVFSPDSKTVAIAADIRGLERDDPYEVRLLDVTKGAVTRTIPHPGAIRRVVFSPDGKTLAIGGQHLPRDPINGPFTRTIQLWNMGQGKMTHEFKQDLAVTEVSETGGNCGLRGLAFSPDGKLLAAADADWKVRLLNVDTGNVQHTLAGHASVVLAVAFSPDGNTLVSGSADKTIRVWDVKNGKELRTLQGNKGPVWDVACSPDGKLLATAGTVAEDGTRIAEVILWDAVSWERRRALPAEASDVTAVAFSPGKGETLAVGTGRGIDGQSSGEIRLWRLSELLNDDR